ELDLYGGWAGDFGQIGVDVGLYKYLYFADDNDVDFTEAYLGVSFGMFSAKASFQIDGADIGNYYEAGADIPLGEDFTLALHVGKYDYDVGDDPTDISVGVSTEVAGLGLDATYYDSDEDVYGSLGGGRFVVTVSKSM
ncbi:MAG: TorF family putative porin, partial [Paracoccaceae bacterium]